MLPVKPTADRLLLRRIPDEYTASGLALPDSVQMVNKFEILARGPGKYEHGVLVPIPEEFEVGATVVFPPEMKNPPGKIPIYGEEYFLVGWTGIPGILCG